MRAAKKNGARWQRVAAVAASFAAAAAVAAAPRHHQRCSASARDHETRAARVENEGGCLTLHTTCPGHTDPTNKTGAGLGWRGAAQGWSRLWT